MKIFLIACISTFSVSGCAPSFRTQLKQTGSREEAIENAILDFCKTNSNLKKQDSVFHISFYDTLYRMVLEKVDDRNYKWIEGKPYIDILAVDIGGASNYQFFLKSDMKIGTKGKLPSRIIKKDGKVFYWWDDNYPLTEQVINLFKEYHLFQDDMGGSLTIPSNAIDDSKKGIHYYFCRNNLGIYKKVISRTAIGYYEAPIVKCE